MMRSAPERVAKLCLLNTAARSDSADKLHLRKQMIQTAKKGGFDDLTLRLSNSFVFREPIKKSVQEMFLRTGPLRLIHDETAMIQRSELFSILPTIQVPTLIIHARQDQVFTLDMQEEMGRLIPNAKLALVEDSGHMSPMEQSEAITALMRLWLNYL
jgi:pimeloyl-ACP methyl ester carboxylesterase